MSRARKRLRKKSRRFRRDFSNVLNDSRRKFCNFPSIFLFACPWKNTFLPNNRGSFPHRNRDISLRPNTISPIRQSVFRISRIYIAKKAFFLSLPFFDTNNTSFIILPRARFGKRFCPTKSPYRLKSYRKIRPRPAPSFQTRRRDLRL